MRPILGLIKVIFIVPPEEGLEPSVQGHHLHGINGSSLAALEQQSAEHADDQPDHDAHRAPDPAQSLDGVEDGVVQDVETDVGVEHLPLAVLVDGGAGPASMDLYKHTSHNDIAKRD